ncbi:hypothetical protein HA402_010418 [Bradysia odoriphaga]|nr:hypothetical protein HA402_010418 [Bradysia odoriphaga]
MLFQIIFVCVLLSYTSAQVPLTKQYKFETYFKANWYDAYLFCRDHGMQLATVNTPDEHETIARNLPKTNVYPVEYDDFWLSGTDLAQEGNYKWFSTGKAMSYTAWELTPNQDPYAPIVDNVEDCVFFHGVAQRWLSTNCTTLNYFICETV